MTVISELARRFPQLYIKPEKGVSESQLYRSIVRRGEQYSGSLSHFICSDEDSLTAMGTPPERLKLFF